MWPSSFSLMSRLNLEKHQHFVLFPCVLVKYEAFPPSFPCLHCMGKFLNWNSTIEGIFCGFSKGIGDWKTSRFPPWLPHVITGSVVALNVYLTAYHTSDISPVSTISHFPHTSEPKTFLSVGISVGLDWNSGRQNPRLITDFWCGRNTPTRGGFVPGIKVT